MTPSQITALRGAIFTSFAAAAALIAAGDASGLLAWCNTPTATKAWRSDVTGETLQEPIIENAAQADNLAAGRRWVLDRMLSAPRLNMTQQKLRDGLAATVVATPTDVQALRRAMLRACREDATNAEVALGGTTATVDTISALVRNWEGEVSEIEARQLVFKDDGTIWTA